MSRRRFSLLVCALVAVNAFFWLAQGSFALPRAMIDRFFGPRITKAWKAVPKFGLGSG